MSRSSRRSVLILVGFVAVFVLAELAARVLMTTTAETIRWYDAVAQHKVAQMDERTESVDTVFAGTSMAAQGLSPDTFAEHSGRSAYNAGLAGGTPEVMKPWLLDEVTERLDPSTVIWGLSALDIAPRYGDLNGEAYADAVESRTGPLARVEQTAAAYSSLLKNRVTLRRPDEMWGSEANRRQRELDDAVRFTSPVGQRIDYRIDQSAERGAIMSARLAEFAPSVPDLDRIVETAQILSERGIDVVFVEMPVPDRFVDRLPRGAADQALVGPTISRAAELAGARFIQLTDGFRDDEFVDFTHLDEPAAERLTRRLVEALDNGVDDMTPFPGRTAAAESVARPECETETIVDEYGFLIEVCVD